MSKMKWLLFISGLCLMLLVGAQVGCAPVKGGLRERIRERIEKRRAEQARASEDSAGTIQVGGLSRNYLLHVPPSYEKGKLLPLVLVFHGGQGQPQQMARHTRFSELSDHEDFIVVYPEGIDRHWNDGRRTAPQVDDVGFVRALIDHLGKSWSIDRHRVYATGISNGGMFSQRLACELSGTIAAVATVAGQMPEDFASQCKPSKPVSVLMMNGTDDPLVPYGGGALSVGSRGLGGRVLSTADTVKFWVAHNRASRQPVVTMLPDKDAQDGTRVRREEYVKGRDGAEVVLYAIEGGGHTWPGGRPYLPERIIGKTSRDVEGSEVVWEFFERHAVK